MYTKIQQLHTLKYSSNNAQKYIVKTPNHRTINKVKEKKLTWKMEHRDIVSSLYAACQATEVNWTKLFVGYFYIGNPLGNARLALLIGWIKTSRWLQLN